LAAFVKAEGPRLPVHVGIIMDGNGRWANSKGRPRQFGHREGAKAFKRIVNHALEKGIKYITFYAFSTENWKRPKEEIDTIMKLFENYLDDVRKYSDKNVRVLFIGDKSRLEKRLQEKMVKLENDSASFDAMTLILAVNYGGRDEILSSCKKICELVRDGFLEPEQVDGEIFEGGLYTAGIPDVDLLIRPSGEMRISNFLIWQCAYAELYFTDVLWPDFSKKDFDKAIDNYSVRSRRFGGV
jgi:undecaprenyl diphosphate synthase